VPSNWPPSDENAAAIADYISQRGEQAYQRALTVGQYRHADGMFFGGHRSVWSTRVLQTVFEQHGAACDSIGWIDFHTGLGPYGHGEKICVGQLGNSELQRARDWWGADVTSPLDGTSVAADVAGLCKLSWGCRANRRVSGQPDRRVGIRVADASIRGRGSQCLPAPFPGVG
jgi:Protein of unknown function (DUF2817)